MTCFILVRGKCMLCEPQPCNFYSASYYGHDIWPWMLPMRGGLLYWFRINIAGFFNKNKVSLLPELFGTKHFLGEEKYKELFWRKLHFLVFTFKVHVSTQRKKLSLDLRRFFNRNKQLSTRLLLCTSSGLVETLIFLMKTEKSRLCFSIFGFLNIYEECQMKKNKNQRPSSRCLC